MKMAIVKKHSYWIHDKKKDESSLTGYLYLPHCKCGNCGYESNMEKPVCPSCGAIMDRHAPVEPSEK
jgi:rubrerythrin